MTDAARHELPDPLAFASDALAARGALVEHTGDGACMCVLPEEIAGSLGLPESCALLETLATEQEGAAACGIGSPLLERLAERARESVPVAQLAVEIDRPRPAQARALAERFSLRNAVFEVRDIGVVEARYLVAWIGWAAEADDRYEGRLALAVHAGDGGEPDASIVSLADPTRPANRLATTWGAPTTPPAEALALVGRRAASTVLEAVADARAAVARRHARDHRRIVEYFAALATDARAPRRRVDEAAISKKLEHLLAERDAKLRDLGARYAMRVSLAPVAVVCIALPAAHVKLRVRRRKREGEMIVRLPAGAASLDRTACAACGCATVRPALCDDALHALCETCVPLAQGRPQCAACG